MTVLDELLGLKLYRENKAEMGLVKCRLALAEVGRRTDEARDALTKYQRWSMEHELSLYGAMYGRAVRPRDLEYLREDVVMLRVEERELHGSLTKVEKERQQADTEVRAARAAHEQASRTREKFVQLIEVQSEEIRVESERKEDVEMDDLFSGRREREDWQESEDE